LPLQIVQSGELPNVFAPDVKGRVNPEGSFDDLSGTIEYFYGLGGVAGSPTSFVSQVNFPYLLADDNMVSARSDVTFGSVVAGSQDFNITLKGIFRFNDERTISSHDVSAINLGKALDRPQQVRPQFITKLCGGIMTACTDTLPIL
jgi:hypothetical protein